MHFSLLKVRIDGLNKSEFAATLKSGNKFKIAKVNTEFLIRSYSEEKFENTLNSFDLNIADGVGVLWAAKYLSIPITKTPIFRQIQALYQIVYTGASLVFYPQYCRFPIPEAFRGVEMMKLMLKVAEEEKMPIFLFGSSEETLEKAVKNIKAEFEKIDISGSRHGYDFKDEEVVKVINQSGAVMLFVALGSPQQEYWIEKNIKSLKDVKIAVGEGGSFEFLAGTFKRAPKWMRRLGLEWLWRLFANKNKTIGAGNRAKRVWNAVPVFIFEVLKFKLKNK